MFLYWLPDEMINLGIYQIKLNILLILIPPASFNCFNVIVRKFLITYIAHIMFLLDSNALYQTDFCEFGFHMVARAILNNWNTSPCKTSSWEPFTEQRGEKI